jgi:hypothetical protein
VMQYIQRCGGSGLVHETSGYLWCFLQLCILLEQLAVHMVARPRLKGVASETSVDSRGNPRDWELSHPQTKQVT